MKKKLLKVLSGVLIATAIFGNTVFASEPSKYNFKHKAPITERGEEVKFQAYDPEFNPNNKYAVPYTVEETIQDEYYNTKELNDLVYINVRKVGPVEIGGNMSYIYTFDMVDHSGNDFDVLIDTKIKTVSYKDYENVKIGGFEYDFDEADGFTKEYAELFAQTGTVIPNTFTEKNGIYPYVTIHMGPTMFDPNKINRTSFIIAEDKDAEFSQSLNHMIFEKPGDNGEYFTFTKEAGEAMYQAEKSYIEYVPDDKDHFIVPFRFGDFEVGKSYHTYINFGERKTPVEESVPESTEKQTEETKTEASDVIEGSKEQVTEVNKVPLTYIFLGGGLVVLVITGVVAIVMKKKQ